MAEVKWQARRVDDGVLVDVTADVDGTAMGAPSSNPLEAGGGGVTLDNQSDPPAAITTLIAPNAQVDGSQATLRAVVVSEGEPPDTAAEQFWLALQPGLNTAQLYVRATADDAWILASAGPYTTAASFPDTATRELGFYDDSNGDWVGLVANYTTRTAAMHSISADGNAGVVEITGAHVLIRWWGAANRNILFDDTGIIVNGLPTVNPNIAGALWNDAGTLKVSAG